jgi:hypothetical protein
MPKVSSLALATGAVVAPVPAHPDPLSLLPAGDAGTDVVDDARHFMTGNAGVLDSGP